jgi:hypothetical protein
VGISSRFVLGSGHFLPPVASRQRGQSVLWRGRDLVMITELWGKAS